MYKYDAYVINLDTRKDRKEYMINEFKDTNLNLNFIEAIKEKPGWVGCLKSHLKIIEKAKNDNLDFVIVLEDDNVIIDKTSFNKNIEKILEYLQNNLDDWTIFNGGPVLNKLSKCSKKIDYIDTKLYELSYCSAAGFIIYNKNVYDFFLTYKDLIKHKHKNTYKIDMIIFNNYKILSTYPILCKQLDNDKSDIYEIVRNDINKLYESSNINFKKIINK